MKTIFKILGVIILVIILAMLILPFIFKGKIIELAKEEINKSVNAEVSFSDIHLNLFTHFPNFTLGIDDILVIGKDEFASDTLAAIPEFSLVLDLSSVISDDNYSIKSIIIEKPTISVKFLENGKANYDIAVESTEPVEEVPTAEESGFNLSLKNFEIRDGKIRYEDESLQVNMLLEGVNHKLSGDLSADFTSLNTKTIIDRVNLDYEGIRYISNAKADYTAQIDADLKNEIYTLKDNSLTLNNLIVQFFGSVSMIGDDINMVITYDAPKTDLKTLLSLVPALYSKDFESIETSGKIALNGNVKGIYNDTTYPAFALNLNVDNGQFKYPDLPAAVSNISIITSIGSPDGDFDHTIIDVSKFHMELGKNPLDFALLVKTPISDPDIKSTLKGSLDLASVKDFYPLESGDELKGLFTTDITLEGKLSSLENEKYEEFTAFGSMLIKYLEYKTNQFNDPVNISSAQLNFSPQYFDLVSFNTKIGQNDLSAQGRLDNVLAWFLKDDILSGQLKIQSSYLNLDDLMPADTNGAAEINTETDTAALSVIEIPANIDFILESNIDKLLYNDMIMEQVNGKIIIKDRKVNMENLSMNLLDGEMKVNGSYATPLNESPAIDFNLNIKNIDIQKAYNTFSMMKEYVPIAEKTKGSFSTKMLMQSKLDNEMMPVYETMTGGGEFSTTQVIISDVNTLNKIADLLKWDDIKQMTIDKILFQFEFVDGRIKVEPFDFSTNNFKANIGGYTGFDQSIDYLMNLQVARSKLGGGANAFVENMTKQANSKGTNFSLGETIPLAVKIGGTLSEPTVSGGFGNMKENLVNQVKEEVKKEVEKKIEEVSQEARERAQKLLDDADAQGKKLIEEAEKQAQNIRKNSADAAQKVRTEAEKQAKNVEDEGKKKGLLAEAAAKESAKKIRKNADEQATKLEQEGDKSAGDLVQKAKNESAKLKQDAQTEADKLLKVN